MSSMATSSWRCVRRCVPLNAMCSRKCAAPLFDAASYLLPASIHTPSVTVSHSAGTLSVATLRPFLRVVTSVYSGSAPTTAADDLCLCITRRAWRSMAVVSRRRASGGCGTSRRRRLVRLAATGVCGNPAPAAMDAAAQRWMPRCKSTRKMCRERTAALASYERLTKGFAKLRQLLACCKTLASEYGEPCDVTSLSLSLSETPSTRS